MKEESKQCYNCRYFIRYYTREVNNYKMTKCGRCYKNGEFVTVHDRCENFTFKTRRLKDSYTIRECLNNLLTDITAIRQIVEEEYNDDKL